MSGLIRFLFESLQNVIIKQNQCDWKQTLEDYNHTFEDAGIS